MTKGVSLNAGRSIVRQQSRQCRAKSAQPIEEEMVEAWLFRREMDAKNEAYSFILEMGLLREFSQFCYSTQGENHHERCLHRLANM